jgi:hypothetical protein
MEHLGVPVGPPRLPNGSLSAKQKHSLYENIAQWNLG